MLSNVKENWREAMLYERQPRGSVLCRLCSHFCRIEDGRQGLCRVRENRGGTLYALTSRRLSVRHVDAIEKKPLFHFYPGSRSYSIATYGCNFRCGYCTNWMVSQTTGAQPGVESESAVAPEELVAAARSAGCRSIAYTYIEPTIFFEYIYDTARLAQAAGLQNVFKTNGFMSAEMLDSCRSFLDAANVDLKAFRDATYQTFGGRLQPVLDNLKRMKDGGVWLEVTTVIIPGINDELAELKELAAFIVDELGAETPWHISRFFPAYRMTNSLPTPVATLRLAREIGLKAGLRYVYSGSLPDEGSLDTSCYNCGKVLIKRRGFELLSAQTLGERCPSCAAKIAGIGIGDI